MFEEGDLVFAMNDIAEVMKSRTSPYGYTSCEVKFLTRPPFSDMPTDWMPTANIVRILPVRGIREYLFRARNEAEMSEGLREALGVLEPLPDHELMAAAKAAMVELHRKGLLVPSFRRPTRGRA